jgi:tight adherence protein B
MTLIILLFIIFCTVALVVYTVLPAFFGSARVMGDKRQQRLANNMEQLMSRQEAKKKSRFLVLAPLIGAGGLYLLAPEGMKLYAIIIGGTFGFIFPGFYIQFLTRKTRDKFSDQLVDALMIMSSSFRGGLSLVQALEAVVEEMPDPINKEFGTVLGENKMGVSLEEALFHLYSRMPSSAMQQMITAILLARETGGNLPIIFTRIVNNIRENKKIQQNLDTLTIQGKLQGIVMSLLPIAFGFIVYSSNRRLFDHMLVSDMGRALLAYAAVSELIGAVLIWKISTFKDF